MISDGKLTDSGPHTVGAGILLDADRRCGHYIRNSVKLVIDAYNGSRTFHCDPKDPVIIPINPFFLVSFVLCQSWRTCAVTALS